MNGITFELSPFFCLIISYNLHCVTAKGGKRAEKRGRCLSRICVQRNGTIPSTRKADESSAKIHGGGNFPPVLT